MSSTPRLSSRHDTAGGVLAFLAAAPSVFAVVSLLELAGIDRAAAFTGCCLAVGVSTIAASALCRLPLVFTPGVSLAALWTFSMYFGAGIPRDVVLLTFTAGGIVMVLLGLIRLGPALLDAVPPFLLPALASGIGLLLIGAGLRQAGMLVAHPVSLVVLGDLTARAPVIAGAGVLVMGIAWGRRYPHAMLIGAGVSLVAGIGLGTVTAKSMLSAPVAPWMAAPSPASISKVDGETLAFVPSILLIVVLETTGVWGALRGLLADGWNPPPGVRSRLWACTAVTAVVAPLFGVPGPVPGPEGLAGVTAGGRTQRVGYVAGALFLLSPVVPVFIRVFGEGYPVGPEKWLHPLVAPLLIFSGLQCLAKLRRIEWENPDHAFPAAAVVALTPLSFSIVNGVASGVLVHALIQTIRGNIRTLHPVYLVLVPLLALRYWLL